METTVNTLLARIDALEIINKGLTDSRDGNRYNIVKIGEQFWMAENLKYLPSVVGSGTGSNTEAYYYVYGYNGTSVSAAKATANYATYGVLYNWISALNACPSGWHLSSDAEWQQLEMYLGMPPEQANEEGWRGTDEGGKLKEAGTTHWTAPNAGANNESGFTALPGGFRDYYDGSFNSIGYDGIWWSSTEYGTSSAWVRGLGYDNTDVGRYYDYRESGFSVRCVRDN